MPSPLEIVLSLPWYTWAILIVVVAMGFFAKLAPTAPVYDSRTYLFTKTEWLFYKRLAEAFQGRYLIMGKPRIADVLFVRKGLSKKRWWRSFTKISSKHVDYIIVSPITGAIVACVELDDPSHLRQDRQERDRFVNQAFAESGIPLLRYSTGRNVHSREIAQDLERILKPQREG